MIFLDMEKNIHDFSELKINEFPGLEKTYWQNDFLSFDQYFELFG